MNISINNKRSHDMLIAALRQMGQWWFVSSQASQYTLQHNLHGRFLVFVIRCSRLRYCSVFERRRNWSSSCGATCFSRFSWTL